MLPLSEKLSPHFDVSIFNFSGHGAEATGQEFSIDLFAEDVVCFMTQQKIEDASIFGYSMGGYVALKMAVLYPEKVTGIVTLGTKFDWTADSSAREVQMLIPDVIEEKIPKFAEELKRRHKPQDWKNVVRKTAVMMTGLGNGKAITPAEFEIIQHPVMICVGSEDKMVSIQESRFVALLLKNGTLNVIPGLKHPIELIDTELLAGTIQGFLTTF